MDDPKDIGLAVDIACWIAALLLILGLPTFVATAGTLAVDAILPGNRSLRRLLLVVAATVAMVGAVLVIRADPFGITSWFFD
ncbi:MAG TPA: hypothetical protein DCY13_11510 [Verrucomicrobiales bacterium]|nr:hypothetical protein [Verrucomicrobiales bacterium]